MKKCDTIYTLLSFEVPKIHMQENPRGSCQYHHLALLSFPKDSLFSAAGDVVLGKKTQ